MGSWKGTDGCGGCRGELAAGAQRTALVTGYNVTAGRLLTRAVLLMRGSSRTLLKIGWRDYVAAGFKVYGRSLAYARGTVGGTRMET